MDTPCQLSSKQDSVFYGLLVIFVARASAWTLVSSFNLRRKTLVLKIGCVCPVRPCVPALADSRGRRVGRRCLLVLASTLLCTIGCEKHAASGGRAAGQTVKQPADGGTAASDSLYGSTSYELLAVLVNKQSKASTLPTLRVHGSPKSVVKKRFSPVIAHYEAELAEAQRRASETIAEIEETTLELDSAERTLTSDYETMRPKESDGPHATARNPLRDLSKVRASKTKADDWFKEAYAERITPIKAALKGLYQRKIADQLAIQFLRAGFKDRLFSALASIPEEDRKQWTTDAHGKATITVPNEEPWAVWAETTHSETVGWVRKRTIDFTHRLVEGWDSSDPEIKSVINVNDIDYPQLKTSMVRWLLHVPDDLDSNKKLVIDQESAFEMQNVTIDSDASEGHYLRKGGS